MVLYHTPWLVLAGACCLRKGVLVYYICGFAEGYES